VGCSGFEQYHKSNKRFEATNAAGKLGKEGEEGDETGTRGSFLGQSGKKLRGGGNEGTMFGERDCVKKWETGSGNAEREQHGKCNEPKGKTRYTKLRIEAQLFGGS